MSETVAVAFDRESSRGAPRHAHPSLDQPPHQLEPHQAEKEPSVEPELPGLAAPRNPCDPSAMASVR